VSYDYNEYDEDPTGYGAEPTYDQSALYEQMIAEARQTNALQAQVYANELARQRAEAEAADKQQAEHSVHAFAADERLAQKWGEAWSNDKQAVGEFIARNPNAFTEDHFSSPEKTVETLSRVYEHLQGEPDRKFFEEMKNSHRNPNKLSDAW
jgi:plasmid replication initiation protein